uniref:Uncharacterized protein n=1 Tax=Arundo donax TaxID=35708 RepID=A0A0A8ZUP8_ARUDO
MVCSEKHRRPLILIQLRQQKAIVLSDCHCRQ